YVLAVPDIHLAAPIIIETGAPVMAYGGFTGHDPILTSDQFAELVKAGAVRYVMLTDGPPMGMTGRGFDDPIGAWVRRHGTEVSPDDWKLFPELVAGPGQRIAPWGPTAEMIQPMFRSPAVRIYDCRPLPRTSAASTGSAGRALPCNRRAANRCQSSVSKTHQSPDRRGGSGVPRNVATLLSTCRSRRRF
ncbi:MAG: hypothetical protein ABIG44_19565, partial [Planctomycetota bacterium]